MGLRPNALYGALRYDCELPELVKRAPTGLLMGMQQLFDAALRTAEPVYKPSLLDLQPSGSALAQRRLHVVLSGIINFKKFFVDVNPLLDRICAEEEQRHLREQVEREEFYDLQEQLQQEREARAKQDATAAEMRAEVAAVRRRADDEELALARLRTAHQEQAAAAVQLHEEEAAAREQQARVDRELEYLRQKVVTSPEALTREAREMEARHSELEEQLGRQYLRLSELDQAAKDHKNMLAFAADLGAELRLLAELRERQQAAEEELARARSAVSGLQVDVDGAARDKLLEQRRRMDAVDQLSRHALLERERAGTHAKAVAAAAQDAERMAAEATLLEAKAERARRDVLGARALAAQQLTAADALRSATDEHISSMARDFRALLAEMV